MKNMLRCAQNKKKPFRVLTDYFMKRKLIVFSGLEVEKSELQREIVNLKDVEIVRLTQENEEGKALYADKEKLYQGNNDVLDKS